MAESSHLGERGSFGRSEETCLRNDNYNSSIGTWQQAEISEQLAKSFELWYAQTNSASQHDQEVRECVVSEASDHSESQHIDTVNGPEADSDGEWWSGPEIPDFDRLDEPEYLPAEISQSSQQLEGEHRHSFLYDLEKRHREPRIIPVKARKWPLSSPPTLSNIGSKHKEKLDARKPARKKLLRLNVEVSWEDITGVWDESAGENDSQGFTDSSSNPVSTDNFEISHSDVSWTELKSMELDANFKKYRPYTQSFLRWCWTARMS